MTILHNSSQDETIPGQGNSCHVTEAVDTFNGGDRRGDCWRDKDNNNAGVGISIGVGPNSGGNDGDCTSSLCTRGGGLPGQAVCHDDKPRVAPRQAAARVGGGSWQGQITKATDKSGWKMTNDDTVVSSNKSGWMMTNDDIVGRL